ncbi:MAG: glutamine--tRNA ligase/YqeY domain fusion protein [Kiritimatiellaeota bacterium]|nr:glutamine--tRNA ligase/YqeY domain fusion protein [Kiritimatiellota bacterium]
MNAEPSGKPQNFIREIIENSVAGGASVHTRFPPEPNGHLHIGHAKAMCIDFGFAKEFGGKCNLRFDDTNPAKEDMEYVEAIQRDVRWLGFDWDDRLFFASDYFERMFELAVELIRKGKAYVCDQTPEEIREYRGSLTEPGRKSPFRNRSIEENLDLFERMRTGEFEDGSKTLRAKIDMTAPNLNLRDPVMYRIVRFDHYRLGDSWRVYPTYDWAHGIEDSIEGITFSLCDLDFENHRPLYDWFLSELDIHHPRQIEFARLNLSYTVMSKRKLMSLVESGMVSDWDDPRMPTLSGLRRRGVPPEAIRSFCETIGVTKVNSLSDIALFEHCVRDVLNKTAPRVMAVIDPLKVVIVNYPEDAADDELDAVNNPEDPSAGTRKVPFSKTLYIERSDFMIDPPKKFFRLGPGREVRLRYAYFIRCVDYVQNEEGEVVELRCEYDPETRGGNAPDGRKVKATLHWVSAEHAIDAEVRLYDRLFLKERPDAPGDDSDFREYLNPDSFKALCGCKLEPSLKNADPDITYQFERLGYFRPDCVDHSSESPVFNRTISLRDSWAKAKGKT